MTQKVKSAKKFFQHYSHLNGISVQMRQALKGKKERIFFLRNMEIILSI